MDTFLAIASRRETRDYAERALPEDVAERILDAGRLAGSARNRQPWRFVLVQGDESRARLAQHVYVPENLLGAALVVGVALAGAGGELDAGRAVQNMLLAAWNDGVGGTPNGLTDAAAAATALGLPDDLRLVTVLSLGYPRRAREPGRRPAAEWSAAADRRPLESSTLRF